MAARALELCSGERLIKQGSARTERCRYRTGKADAIEKSKHADQIIGLFRGCKFIEISRDPIHVRSAVLREVGGQTETDW